jgi:hypothetical protein
MSVSEGTTYRAHSESHQGAASGVMDQKERIRSRIASTSEEEGFNELIVKARMQGFFFIMIRNLGDYL